MTKPAPEIPPADPMRLKVALIVFGMGVALLIAEVVLRYHNPFGFRMRGNTIVLPVNQTYTIEDPNLQAFDKLDKRVIHTKNSLGFRGAEPPLDFSEHLTILTVGGSTTEGFYLSDNQTWTAQMERRLKPNFPKLWINNAGLDGHSTFGHLVLVNDFVSQLGPKVALFLIGINDLFADSPNKYDRMERNLLIGTLANHSELVALGLNMLRHSRTTSMKSLGAMPRPINLKVPEYREVTPEEEQSLLRGLDKPLAQYESRLARLIKMTRQAGIEPVLITQPALFGEGVDDVTLARLDRVDIEIHKKMNGRVAWKLLERYNDVTRKLGREQGVTVIDLAAKLPKSSRYFYDYLHYGKEGAAKVAEIVAHDLCPKLKAKWPEHAKGDCR
jgi:lysophospholipase L1-like esterase